MSKLANLVKYNARSIFRFLGIFYALFLFAAILTRLTSHLSGGFVADLIKGFMNGFFWAMLANTLVNNLIRLWTKIRQNLYGPEAYLTQALPVKGKTLYFSWLIVGLLSWFATAVVIVVGLLIAYASPELFSYLGSLFTPIAEMLQISIAELLIALLLVAVLEILNLFFIGVLAIVIGNRFVKNRLLWSIISGVIIYSISQIIILGTLYLLALFNDQITTLFSNNAAFGFNQLDVVLWTATVFYGAFVVAEVATTAHLLSKGVDIE